MPEIKLPIAIFIIGERLRRVCSHPDLHAMSKEESSNKRDVRRIETYNSQHYTIQDVRTTHQRHRVSFFGDLKKCQRAGNPRPRVRDYVNRKCSVCHTDLYYTPVICGDYFRCLSGSLSTMRHSPAIKRSLYHH